MKDKNTTTADITLGVMLSTAIWFLIPALGNISLGNSFFNLIVTYAVAAIVSGVILILFRNRSNSFSMSFLIIAAALACVMLIAPTLVNDLTRLNQ